ncbi:hypothetical protein Dsin_032670 [Dipteronia sinensis]|uniref:Jacalin-type lectin domain-containing protein n=1 Tax=Dipteronia sinensis TaxID=43782 RepID=A0AAD9Z974_9ROSI|nr:hypothetical protein Dsin_032670 [Dipteronia sinensis]
MGSTHNLDRSPIKGELWGGQGGRDWDYRPENGIVEITIQYADAVDSLTFTHAIENSTDNSSEKFGGRGGKLQQTITIDWPNEYLTKISGTIVSEKNRAIVGFFGRLGNFIDAIGVYYKDPPAPIETTKVNTAITLNKDIPREVGPWGGNKGKAWDDGRLKGRITEIDVHVGNGVIHGIHYRYESEDSCDASPIFLSNKHGGEGATTIYRIKLEKENTDHRNRNKNICLTEDLVGISGFYGAFDGNCCVEYQVVRSISFYTTKGKYGPFGTEIGTFFNSPACTNNAKVVGFHGRSGEYLDAIGIHFE